MTTLTLPGRGLLSGEWDSERIDKELAEERAKDRDYAAREAAYKARLEKIDTWLGSLLKDQLEAVSALPPITEKVRSTFHRFQDSCQRAGLPWLPANGSVVAEYLIVECLTATEATAVRDAISTVHRAMKLPDPTQDVVVRATQLWFKNNEIKPEPKRPARAKKLNGASKKENQ